MKRSALTEFEIEEEGLKLRICRSSADASTNISSTTPPFAVVTEPIAPPAPTAVAPVAKEAVGPAIKSPMVGTFYSAPSPDNPDFVKVGDTVTPETVVCIIEAMKVMNEILAETTGVISEMCVTNGDSVEFGQPLFRLK